MTKGPYSFELSRCAFDKYGDGKEFGRKVRWLCWDDFYGFTTGMEERVEDESVRESMLSGEGVTPPDHEFGDAEKVATVLPHNRREYFRALELRQETADSPHAGSERIRRSIQFYDEVLGHFAEWFRSNGYPIPDKNRDDFALQVEAIAAALSAHRLSYFNSKSDLYVKANDEYGLRYKDPKSTFAKSFKKHFPSRFGISTVPDTPEEWAQFIAKLRETRSGMAE